MAVTNAKKAALYLLKLSERADVPLTNMELQKLLYYAQGKYMVEHDQLLFDEDLQAWKYGPVIPEIYEEFRRFGSSPIYLQDQEVDLSEAAIDHLETIFKEYSHLDGIKLSQMTHSERPWIKARGTLKENEQSKNIIKKEWIKDFFSRSAEERKNYSDQINIIRKIVEKDRDVLVALAQ